MTTPEIKINIKLKARISDLGLKNKWVAEQADIDPSIFSGIVNGYRIPTSAKQRLIAAILNCNVEDIF